MRDSKNILGVCLVNENGEKVKQKLTFAESLSGNEVPSFHNLTFYLCCYVIAF